MSANLWGAFENALPESNLMRIPATFRGICLKIQLYGVAKYLCSGISKIISTNEDGVQLILDYIYQRDVPSLVSDDYRKFNDLLNCLRGTSETMENYE